MNKTGIVTDSHSGIGREEAERLGIYVLPMPYFFGEECFTEGVDISREEFFERLKKGEKVSTAQASLKDLMDIWDAALKEHEDILYIPISSGLSGACSTAMALAREEKYAGRVHVVDNGRVATPLHRSVLDAVELLGEGCGAREVKDRLEKGKDNMVIYIGVPSFERLKASGRVKPAVAFVGGLLDVKPILVFSTGLLDSFKNCRGLARMKKELILAMKNDIQNRFSEWLQRGELYLMAASSESSQAAKDAWVAEIQRAFPDLEVMYDDLTLGVACHLGEGALGIACACKP